jgi:major type 1 subunit fimbrin (pilin)
MKKLILSAAIIASVGALASQSAMAADGTITFNGEVTATTCKIQGGGTDSPDFAVTLPTVSTSAFAGGVGTAAGAQPYNIILGGATDDGCTDGTPVSVHYEPSSANVDATSGNLNIATGAGAATGLQLQVLDSDKSKIDLALDPDSTPVVVTNKTAVLPFYVQYVSNAAAVTAGGVRSSVLYSIKYN